jgi:hypothetical protein
MPELPLLNRLEQVLVSPEDVAYLSQCDWSLKGKYAGRGKRLGGRGSLYVTTWMHRVVAQQMGLQIDGLVVDHINRNKLDNRRSNLRAIPKCLDHFNKGPRSDSRTGVKGVYRRPNGRYWSTLTVGQRVHYLGSFANLKAAVSARHKAEERLLPNGKA